MASGPWMWWFSDWKNGGGGSLVIPNEFFFANDAERDQFFIDNPEKLKDGIYVISGGMLQQYQEPVWVDMTPAITGPVGPKGDTGATGPQGIQGEQGIPGADGTDGFSPIITVKTETPDIYVLTITTATGSYDTPNLRGGGSGSYGIFEYATATPYTTGNAMYSGNALYIAVKSFTSSSMSADLLAGNIIQVASGGTSDTLIYPYASGSNYKTGMFFYADDGRIFTALDDYTSVDIDTDLANNDIKLLGGSEPRISPDEYNTITDQDGIYSQQEVINFDHEPTPDEIAALPDGIVVNVETDDPTAVYLSTADILDILTSGAVDKALSANQGRVLAEKMRQGITKWTSEEFIYDGIINQFTLGFTPEYVSQIWVDGSVNSKRLRRDTGYIVDPIERKLTITEAMTAGDIIDIEYRYIPAIV